MPGTIPTLRSLRLYDSQLTPYLHQLQLAGSDDDYRQVKRQFRSSLQKILKSILRRLPEKSRINDHDVKKALRSGGGNDGQWPGLNPGWCDQNPSQCQDSFTSCTGGAPPTLNSGYCDQSPSQCTDNFSAGDGQAGGAILEPVAFQRIVRRAMNSLQDPQQPKTISSTGYRAIQQVLEAKMSQVA